MAQANCLAHGARIVIQGKQDLHQGKVPFS
jgi:hypothetical protein